MRMETTSQYRMSTIQRMGLSVACSCLAAKLIMAMVFGWDHWFMDDPVVVATMFIGFIGGLAFIFGGPEKADASG